MNVSVKQRPLGFTLIEMLVVMAVVALLAGTLMGVFTRVREGGYNATCQSNLHQMGMALQQYVADNNGTYLPSPHLKPPPVSGLWCELLQPYLKNTQVFRCPSNTENWTNKSPLPGANLAVSKLPYRVDYSYNYYHLLTGLQSFPKPPYYAGKSESVTPTSSQFFVIFDIQEYALAVLGSCGQQGYYYLHSGGANYLFADGHVRWLSSEQQGEAWCNVEDEKSNNNPD